MTANRIGRLAMAIGAAAFMTACEDGDGPAFLQRDPGPKPTGATSTESRMTEREVEAPEVFEATGHGLWDGRPSLGGVWVAHPDATDPERVMIRNLENGNSVVGALFRREREVPGPKLQVSSDAASALKMLAGNPTELSVVALRKKALPDPAAPGPEEPQADAEPLAAAAAAIERAETGAASPGAGAMRPAPRPATAPAARRTPRMTLADVNAPPPGEVDLPEPPGMTAAAAAEPTPAAAPRSGLFGVRKPYVQVGVFTERPNAEATADRLRQSGIIPTVRDEGSEATPLWRVVVGPSRNRADRAQVLEQIKALGYTDAYYASD
ncbi:Cell division protein DedD (protein involved in septation) [Rhodovulum sp. ES.010]|uniref:SPOR domain-containing protein n=1 Tax=Rhodovulum sp. ES.010 TaxID=1882821 RepID=UPI000927B60A|nr:SPOR domain-containing protein [Rhodovulum sp. ES.010]SIO35689.1 Cell division protein DedD (protein involved in septation) [Rhodovulum sp. ES.010]